METVKEFRPKWGEYYVAKVSIKPGNPMHLVIIYVVNYDKRKDVVAYDALSYEDKERFRSDRLHYFELVQKIDMEYERTQEEWDRSM